MILIKINKFNYIMKKIIKKVNIFIKDIINIVYNIIKKERLFIRRIFLTINPKVFERLFFQLNKEVYAHIQKIIDEIKTS